jgi:hypothetical protein
LGFVFSGAAPQRQENVGAVALPICRQRLDGKAQRKFQAVVRLVGGAAVRAKPVTTVPTSFGNESLLYDSITHTSLAHNSLDQLEEYTQTGYWITACIICH